MCTACGYPERLLWTFKNLPRFEEVEVGTWMVLHKCAKCGMLWCEVPHEPYASFPFATAWPYGQSAWRSVHDLDDAVTLHEWHDAVIREQWRSLPNDEQKAVESWRERTYRAFNRIDQVKVPMRIHLTTDIVEVIDRLSPDGAGG